MYGICQPYNKNIQANTLTYNAYFYINLKINNELYIISVGAFKEIMLKPY